MCYEWWEVGLERIEFFAVVVVRLFMISSI